MQKDIKYLKFFGAFIMGMYVITPGSIMVDIRESFSLSLSEGGLILAIFSATNLISGLLSGFLVDKFGAKPISVLSGLLFAVSPIAFFFANDKSFVYISFSIIGAAWGLLNTEQNLVVNTLSKGDNKTIGLMHMMFGVGAFVFPMLYSIALSLGQNYIAVFILMIVLSSIYTFYAIKIEMPKIEREHGEKVKISNHLLSLLIYIGIFVFYVGSENIFNGWIVTVLVSGKGFEQTFAQSLLSLFWLVMIFSRLLSSLTVKEATSSIIFGLTMVSIFSVVLLIFSGNSLLVIASIILLGCGMGPLFPLTMAHSFRISHGSGLITSILISAGGLGSSSLPFLAGTIADNFGVNSIQISIILSLVVLSAFAFILKIMDLKNVRS